MFDLLVFDTLPTHPSRLTGGQQGQGHGVVLHVHGEGHQPPITSRIWISFDLLVLHILVLS